MKRIRVSILGGLLVCMMLIFNVQTVEAASDSNVTGTCEYDKAYKVLELVNEKREAAGKKTLKMDKDLLEAAMLRAAEISVSFNHIRPNGQECFSVCDKMCAENIACGYTSPDAVMEGWTKSSGHMNNMLNGNYDIVGIGCFIKDGTRYWVQCFGTGDYEKVEQPDNVQRTYDVSTSGSAETQVSSSSPLSTKVANFKATAGKKKITLTWKKKSNISGYKLQISTSKKFKNKQTYTIGKNKTKKVITKYKGKRLKANKKYYIRIRAYKKSTDEDGIATVKYSKWKTIYKTTK